MSSHQYLPFQSNTIGFHFSSTPLASCISSSLSLRNLSPIDYTSISLHSIACNHFFPIPREPVKNTSSWKSPTWLALSSQTHLVSPSFAQLLPCYLPLQFTFHLYHLPPEELFQLPFIRLIKALKPWPFISVIQFCSSLTITTE